MGAQNAAFADGDSFMKKHIIDSTGFLELVMFLEESWGVTVDDDEMVPENLDSLNNLQEYLSRKVAA
jgi:acyl carrier protein